MKQILLLRHAKSSWDDPGLKDFDRPLNKRGRKDAPRIGSFLNKTGYIPGRVVASPAKRARQTTELVAASAGISADSIHWDEQLYYGSSRAYITAIQATNDEIERVLIVGHNPLMEDVADTLSGGNHTFRMPTAALVCLEHPNYGWKQAGSGSMQLKWMIIPKLIKKLL